MKKIITKAEKVIVDIKKGKYLAILDAELKGNQALADGNQAYEAGDKAKAEKLYAKGQKWLDRYNRLVGNS